MSNNGPQTSPPLGVFPYTDNQHTFKNASTSLLAITFMLFTGYSVVKFIVSMKSDFGRDKTFEVPNIMKSFMRVVESDLAPTLLVWFITMGLGQFYVFAAVMSYLSFACGAALVLAYNKENVKLIVILRCALVFLTLAAFLNLFIDDMIFEDYYAQAIENMRLGPGMQQNSTSSP